MTMKSLILAAAIGLASPCLALASGGSVHQIDYRDGYVIHRGSTSEGYYRRDHHPRHRYDDRHHRRHDDRRRHGRDFRYPPTSVSPRGLSNPTP